VDAEHGQVDGELRAVPPCLGFAPAEDDDAQSGKTRQKLDERRARFVDVGRPHVADLVRVAEVPGDDVPVDDVAAAIDAGVAGFAEPSDGLEPSTPSLP
jgi:hypothetical protein